MTTGVGMTVGACMSNGHAGATTGKPRIFPRFVGPASRGRATARRAPAQRCKVARAQQPTQRSPCELASYDVRVRDELDAGRLDGVPDARTQQRRDLSGMVVSHLMPRQRRGLHVGGVAVELVEA